MKYDLFITDFDGTLGKAPDIIDPETVFAIKEYISRGGKFAIASGRMFDSLKNIFAKYGIFGIAISDQGASIKNAVSGEDIFTGGIPVDLAVSVITDLRNKNVQIITVIDDKLFYEEKSKWTDFYESALVVGGNKVEDLIAFIKNTNKPVLKIAALDYTEKIMPLTEEFISIEKYKGKLIFNNGAPIIMEVVSPFSSKGVAVKVLADNLNIPYEKVIAVGDSNNDLSMMQGAWHTVAVGDGEEVLKSAAKEVTVPFPENPVKFLLEKYCL